MSVKESIREEIRIRPMTREDVDEVSRIEEACFSMPWSRKSFWEMAEAPDARYLVAELTHDGKSSVRLAGVCGVLNMAGDGNITNVAVREEYRGRGIAARLMRRLLADAEAAGMRAFTLEVRASNTAAIRLYEKLGFTGEGYRPNFYEKPTEDALIMWRRT